MTLHIGVHAQRCEGHGLCHAVAPALFPLDEDGFCAIGEARPVPAADARAARAGADACPLTAISLWQTEE